MTITTADKPDNNKTKMSIIMVWKA